jgi:hypothetical protein
MITRRLFYLHTRQVLLGVANVMAILVHLVGTLETLPLATIGWNSIINLVVPRQTLRAP